MCHSEEIYFKMKPNPVYYGKWFFFSPAREGLDVRAQCRRCSIFSPFEVKTVIHALSEEVFLPLRKVTGESTALESKLFSPDDANSIVLRCNKKIWGKKKKRLWCGFMSQNFSILTLIFTSLDEFNQIQDWSLISICRHLMWVALDILMPPGLHQFALNVPANVKLSAEWNIKSQLFKWSCSVNSVQWGRMKKRSG